MGAAFRGVYLRNWRFLVSNCMSPISQVKLYPLVSKFFQVAKKQLFQYPLRWTTFIAVTWPFSSEHSSQFVEKINEADTLYKKGMYSECADCLSEIRTAEDKENVEVLWRLSRAMYNMANDVATDSSKRKEMILKAYELINNAMELDPNHYAVHKWSAILLDLRSSYKGIKYRIRELETVKNHMLVASELNPKDATTLYMLGEWCFQIANMPWYQRSIASTLFSTPPVSTFEEALEYFLKAEQTEPRFYSLNLLMLGKTYLKLGKMEQAKYYLDLALSYPAKTNDDHRANKEAKEFLSKL